MSRLENIKEFIIKHQDKIIMSIGLVLTTTISFAVGRLSISTESKPIKIIEPSAEIVNAGSQNTIPQFKSEGSFVGDINNSEYFPINSAEANNIPEDNKIWFDSQEDAQEQDYLKGKATIIEDNSSNAALNKEEGAVTSGRYVGSKNSTKYHLPDSGSAKRIKEENKVWFKSKEDAEEQGYEASSSVIKAEGES